MTERSEQRRSIKKPCPIDAFIFSIIAIVVSVMPSVTSWPSITSSVSVTFKNPDDNFQWPKKARAPTDVFAQHRLNDSDNYKKNPNQQYGGQHDKEKNDSGVCHSFATIFFFVRFCFVYLCRKNRLKNHLEVRVGCWRKKTQAIKKTIQKQIR